MTTQEGVMPISRWAEETSVVLRLFGERWLIDLSGYADPHAHLARLRELWKRSVDDSAGPVDVRFRPAPSPGASATVLTPWVPDESDGSFPYAFSRAVTQAAIDRHAGSALLFHAAGLTSADGQRGVVLVAASGTGKSTAASRLGQHLGYLSDELVMLDAQQRLQGLPKPLSIVVPGFPGSKDELSPDELGLGPTPGAPPLLSALVCLSRSPDAGAPHLQAITMHDLIAETVSQTSSLWRVDHPLQQLALAAEKAGGPYRLHYSEIAEAEPLLLELFDRPDAGARAWVAHTPGENQRWTARDPGAVGDAQGLDGVYVVRAPWTDAIEHDGEVSILAGQNFTRIAGIAATIWLSSAVATGFTELLTELTREHGEHSAAAELLRAALIELANRGVIRFVADAD
ncbi:MAG: hypothetical protein JST25_13310 [Actinobacteria bacterium]|nr:hypothetical protein [Actinomycetota bacterium]